MESRTSSPLRINRNESDLQRVNTRGLYPAGEGAGYAGGIKAAETLAVDLLIPVISPARSARL